MALDAEGDAKRIESKGLREWAEKVQNMVREAKEAVGKIEREEAKEVAERIERGVKEFGERARKALEVAGAFSPKAVRGIMLVAVTVPLVYLVAGAVGAVAPYVTQYMVATAPFLVMAITMLIALAMVSLAIGLVRTLALG